jgi:hypothetical protein
MVTFEARLLFRIDDVFKLLNTLLQEAQPIRISVTSSGSVQAKLKNSFSRSMKKLLIYFQTAIAAHVLGPVCQHIRVMGASLILLFTNTAQQLFK